MYIYTNQKYESLIPLQQEAQHWHTNKARGNLCVFFFSFLETTERLKIKTNENLTIYIEKRALTRALN